MNISKQILNKIESLSEITYHSELESEFYQTIQNNDLINSYIKHNPNPIFCFEYTSDFNKLIPFLINHNIQFLHIIDTTDLSIIII
mgnify:CR=1 FL=1